MKHYNVDPAAYNQVRVIYVHICFVLNLAGASYIQAITVLTQSVELKTIVLQEKIGVYKELGLF